MAILVRNKSNNTLYFLVGTGFSFYKDSRPGAFGGNLFPHEEEGEFRMAAVCNEAGDIEWFPTDELKVIEIDGVKLSDLYTKEELQSLTEETRDYCPACGAVVSNDAKTCGSCGLTLIVG